MLRAQRVLSLPVNGEGEEADDGHSSAQQPVDDDDELTVAVPLVS